MKKALYQFTRHSTTIVNRQEIVEPDQPVLIACPWPPFKPSFFKELGLNSHGYDKYFWTMDKTYGYQNKFENDTSVLTAYLHERVSYNGT